MTVTDPLGGLERPRGAGQALHGMGTTYLSGAAALGHTSQALVAMVGRLLGQAWSGQAAMACAAACSRNAATVAMAADAYEVAGAALQRYGTRLATAQADYDAARKLADQAVADEQHHQDLLARTPAGSPLVTPVDLFWSSPLRFTARARAEQAVQDARTAAREAAGALDRLLAPFRRGPAPVAAPKKEHHWYSPVTGFLGGAWDGVSEPVVMVGGLVGLHGDVTDNWSALGSGLAHGVTHPLDLGKALVDWQDLSQGHYAHWAGELAPGVAAAFLTGGVAAGVKGADAVSGVSRAGRAVEDLSDAEKATVLSRGEALVPGSVGKEGPARFVTADGKLDYSGIFDSKLDTFGSVVAKGDRTLDRDLWLGNLHNGRSALNTERSLMYGARLDDVLSQSRGGYLNSAALVPQWGPRTHLSLIRVPEGTTLHLAEGPAAPQPSHLTVLGKDTGLVVGTKTGGGTQFLLGEVDRSWVVWTGKAPWPGHTEVALRAAAAGGAVRVPDALADVTAGQDGSR